MTGLSKFTQTQSVPCYPDFVPLDIGLKDILHPRLSLTSDGVSEFTFSGLYLFKDKYNYRISRIPPTFVETTVETSAGASAKAGADEGGFIISGIQGDKTFFMTPCAAPDMLTLNSLFADHDYWKNISETILTSSTMITVRDKLEKQGIVVTEDRDNFDYLYYRNELAELAGKKFHKKKNHVKNFLNSYPDHEQRPISSELIPSAIEILEQWRQDAFQRTGNENNDYKAAREALDLFDSLKLKGSVFFVNSKPVAYCLGESIARGKMFAIHFEKAIDEYRGIYQYVNQAFAASLPRFFTLINREQDLGNEGLRQAKMTYRPCDFVKKYQAIKR